METNGRLSLWTLNWELYVCGRAISISCVPIKYGPPAVDLHFKLSLASLTISKHACAVMHAAQTFSPLPRNRHSLTFDLKADTDAGPVCSNER